MNANLILTDLSDGQLQVSLESYEPQYALESSEPFAFKAPISRAQLEELRWYLEDYLRHPYGPYFEAGERIRTAFRHWGIELFNRVFGPDMPSHSLYCRARQNHATLSIVSKQTAFLGLPWELLRDPSDETPLALRFLAIDRCYSTVPLKPANLKVDVVRILVIIARPAGLDDVSHGIIARPLFRTIAAMGGLVRLDVLRPPTIIALKEQIQRATEADEPYHVLHFDGHGIFARQRPANVPNEPLTLDAGGRLAFENDQGTQHLVSAEEFFRAIADGNIPLIILNACRSAMVGEHSPDTAIATKLIALGASSVVAMGYSVYTSAAAGFVSELYSALLNGKSTSEAVTAGRAWLFRYKGRPSPKGPLPLDDWIVPIHYVKHGTRFSAPRIDQAGIIRSGSVVEDDNLSFVIGSPPVKSRFVGRHRAFHALELAFHRGQPVLIHGDLGIGKTELVEEFAAWWAETRGTYSEAVVSFIRFGGTDASATLDHFIYNSKRELMRHTSLTQIDEAGDDRSTILNYLRRQRALVVLDDLHRLSDLSLNKPGQRAIRQFIEESSNGEGARVVAISRSPEEWLTGITRIALGGLTRQESAEMADAILTSRPASSGRPDIDSLSELFQRAQGNPLALRTFISYLDDIPINTLLAFIDGEIPHLPKHSQLLAEPARLLDSALCRIPANIRQCLPVLSIFGGSANWPTLSFLQQTGKMPRRYTLNHETSWYGVMDLFERLGLATRVSEYTFRLQPMLCCVFTIQWMSDAGEDFTFERNNADVDLIRAYAEYGMLLREQIEKGLSEEALASILAERHTIERLLRLALDKRMFGYAPGLLQPLLDLWKVQGSVDEAGEWLALCRKAVERDASLSELTGSARSFWLTVVSSDGSRLVNSGRLDEAYSVYEQMRSAMGTSPDRIMKEGIIVYHQLGVVARERGDLTAAGRWYRKSLRISRANNDMKRAAGTQYALGGIEKELGNVRKAARRYRLALKLALSVNDRQVVSACYLSLAQNCEDTGDYAAAEQLALNAMEIWNESGDLAAVARSANSLGHLALLQNKLDAASKWLHKAYAIVDRLRDRSGMAGIGSYLGLLAQKAGNLDTANRWYQYAAALFDELGDKGGLARCYHELGTVAQEQRDFNAAEALYKSAIELKEAAGIDAVATYNQLGAIVCLRKEFSQAENFHRTALSLSENAANRDGMAQSYHCLGIALFGARRFEEAKSFLMKSVQIRGAIHDARGMALSYGQLGLLFEQTGEFSEALDCTIRCVNIYVDHPDPMASTAMLHLTRLTKNFGMAELEASWRRTFREQLPQDLKRTVEKALAEATDAQQHRK